MWRGLFLWLDNGKTRTRVSASVAVCEHMMYFQDPAKLNQAERNLFLSLRVLLQPSAATSCKHRGDDFVGEF